MPNILYNGLIPRWLLYLKLLNPSTNKFVLVQIYDCALKTQSTYSARNFGFNIFDDHLTFSDQISNRVINHIR